MQRFASRAQCCCLTSGIGLINSGGENLVVLIGQGRQTLMIIPLINQLSSESKKKKTQKGKQEITASQDSSVMLLNILLCLTNRPKTKRYSVYTHQLHWRSWNLTIVAVFLLEKWPNTLFCYQNWCRRAATRSYELTARGPNMAAGLTHVLV